MYNNNCTLITKAYYSIYHRTWHGKIL